MQESLNNKRCYAAWRNLQKVNGYNATISLQLHRSIPNEAAVYEATVAQVILFLGGRGVGVQRRVSLTLSKDWGPKQMEIF